MNVRRVVTVFLAFGAALSFAGQTPPHKKDLCCPVTRLTIPSTKAAVAKETYKGKTYYFCTMNCKKVFDKNPKKYAK